MAAFAFAEKQPFDRYQSIIDRHPFGLPPPNFDPNKMASEVSSKDAAAAEEQLSQEQAAIQKAVMFSMVNIETDGSVMVGFSDRTNPKTPRHYYLAVGDTQDGWTVKACEVAEETMTIEKDGIEVTLKLGDNSGQGVPRTNRPTTTALAAGDNAAPKRSMLLMRAGSEGRKSRRARRELEEAKEKADAQAREAERKRQAEERAQREAAEKEAREIERAEQRQQLQAIQEELRKAREEKERQKAAEQAAEGQADGAMGGQE